MSMMSISKLFVASLIILQCLSTCSTTAFTDINTDQSALLALKSQLMLPPSHVLAQNWSTSTPVCSWIGVSCGPRHYRVTALDISSMGLVGNLPPDTGNLSFLVSLNLSHNYFHGSLPQELARLRRLKIIHIGFNNLTGEFPSWFEFLPELKSLNLKNNSFTGSLPNTISNLSKLEKIDLAHNSLHGNVPKEIGNCSSLKILNLEFNQFSGSIPMEVFNISNLEVLGLTGNGFFGDLPADLCRGIPRIKLLHLSRNELGGQIPSSISQCSQLQSLSLSYNRLTGFVPKEIGNLSALEILYLGSNHLIGEIPEELGNLQMLRELDAGDTFLTGSIPPTIFGISALQYINFRRCNLTGEFPPDICSNSSYLEMIYFNENELVGHLPERIGECSALQVLVLNDNNITGEIPRSIGNLTMLQRLIISFNNMTGTVPVQIFNMSTLQVFAATMNQLTGSFPSSFCHGLPNMQEFSIGNNFFSGEIPKSISNCSRLAKIDFRSNRLSGTIPDSLGELTYLERLALGGNEYTSASQLNIISSLTNCRYLEFFSFSDTALNETLPVTIGNFSSSLQGIYMNRCGLVGSIPNEIGNLSGLIILSLAENQLTGSIPNTLAKLENMQGLDLDKNNISGEIPINLCELRHLNLLWLHQNQITGAIPDCMGELTTLRRLSIGYNKLNSGIPTSLWQLNDLLELNLSSNFLTGTLPLDFENLNAATTLDLSGNQFSGFIPSSIGNLQNLNFLLLAHNDFTGSIPESTGKLMNLEMLDLSHNNLSGNIPNSLESLRYLNYFNVSFNNLSGRIPSRGPFIYFASQNFMSNEGLCGDPRYGFPPCTDIVAGRSTKRKVILPVVYALLGISALAAAVVSTFIYVTYRKRKALASRNDVQIDTTLSFRVSYYDILHATNGFSDSHLLGKGGVSSVYKATLQNGDTVAIKVLDLQLESAFKSFDAECEVLRSLRHRNLCKIINTCSNDDFKALVLEYMPNGSLERWLHMEDTSLDMMQRISIMIDVACALEYLHHGYSTPVIHCDVKPANVLLDEDMVARVSDFGIAKLLTDGHSFAQTTTFATLGYMAPEYGSEGLVSTSSDVYSYGIMLMEVLTGKNPNSETFGGDLNLRRFVYDFWPNGIDQIIDPRLLMGDEENFGQKLKCMSDIMELALTCSKENPKERINMKEVVVSLKKIKLRLLAFCSKTRKGY